VKVLGNIAHLCGLLSTSYPFWSKYDLGMIRVQEIQTHKQISRLMNVQCWVQLVQRVRCIMGSSYRGN